MRRALCDAIRASYVGPLWRYPSWFSSPLFMYLPTQPCAAPPLPPTTSPSSTRRPVTPYVCLWKNPRFHQESACTGFSSVLASASPHSPLISLYLGVAQHATLAHPCGLRSFRCSATRPRPDSERANHLTEQLLLRYPQLGVVLSISTHLLFSVFRQCARTCAAILALSGSVDKL